MSSKLDCGSYDDLTGDKTFIAWIKPRSHGEGGFGRIFDNSKIESWVTTVVTFRSDGSSTITSAANSITLNQWQLMIITRTSAGVANIYINAVLSGNADQDSGTPAAGTTNIIIGNRNADDRTFDGYISDPRIYSSILTTSEISQIYNSERKNYV